MSTLRIGSAVLATAGVIAGYGCIPDLPKNLSSSLVVERTLVDSSDGVRIYREAGLANGVWLEVDSAAQPVGGYLSTSVDAPESWRADGSAAIAVVLPGASTYYEFGMAEKARDYHNDFCAVIRDVGIRTWTVAVRECGAAYADGDLADALAAIDWLAGRGRALLGIERIYLVGYSAGATLAYQIAQVRTLDAVVAIDGLAGATRFRERRALVNLVRQLYPQNTGVCQFADTLAAYGPADSPAWDRFDAVAALPAFRNPLLVIHGTLDVIFPVEDAIRLRDSYVAAVAAGAALPEIEFAFIEGAGHINVSSRDDIRANVVDYLRRFETAAGR